MVLRITFAVTSIITMGITGGFVAGLLFKSIKKSFAVVDEGLMVWFIVGGMAVGLTTALMVGRRLTTASLKTVTVISTLISIALIAGVILMISGWPSRQHEKRLQQHPLQACGAVPPIPNSSSLPPSDSLSSG